MNWAIETVDPTDNGYGTNMLLDSTGRPHVTWIEWGDPVTINYAYRDDGGVWHKTVVASVAQADWSEYDAVKAAIGGDVIHIIWATGHFNSALPHSWDIAVYHASMAVGGGSFSTAAIWTRHYDDVYFMSPMVAVTVDSTGAGYTLFTGSDVAGSWEDGGTNDLWFATEAGGWSSVNVRSEANNEADLFIDDSRSARPLYCDVNDHLHAVYTEHSGPGTGPWTYGLNYGYYAGSWSWEAVISASAARLDDQDTTLGQAAARAVLDERSEYWVRGIMKQLHKTRGIADRRLREMGCTVPELQGTYLMFPKFNVDLSHKDLYRFMIEKAKVGLQSGADFGPGGEMHLRMTIATSEAILEEALDRIEGALMTLG